MRIDHIGYAVKKIEPAIRDFEKLGFNFERIVDDTDRNVKICFGEKDGYRVELVSRLNHAGESPVDAYLSKIGPIPYHLCYQSDRFDEDILRLQGQGYKIILAPAPAVAFGGRKVAFLMNLSMGLLEIVEG